MRVVTLLPILLVFSPTVASFSTLALSMQSSSTGRDDGFEPEDILVLSLKSSDPEIEQCYEMRNEVFIQEQKVPVEIEMDSYDETAVHILATYREKPCGAARLVISDDKMMGKIGRVCVLSSYRRKGIGRKIMEHAIQELRRILEKDGKAKLGAQTHALKFYESMGFQLVPGEEYLAAGGVPHRDMVLKL